MLKAQKICLLSCVSAISALAAAPAYAAQGDAPAGSSQARESESAAQAVIEDIVVRARKKSTAEREQDVPIALTAVSGSQIAASFATNLTDIGQSMPNVRLDDAGAFPGVSNFTIRGMGFNSTIASVEPTVGTFVDGMYIGANLGGLEDATDLESVEVLRGPQGTLFGRNVTGGAVLMRSRRPTGKFGGLIKLGYGTGNRLEMAGGMQGPITDTLAAKVYASYVNGDGNWHDLTTGRRHGARKTFAVRPILRWRPTSDVDITLIGEHGKTDGDGVASRIIDNPNQYLYTLGAREPQGAENLTINYQGYTHIRWDQVVLDSEFHVGSGEITSITGYRNVSYASSGDTDGTELEVARALNSMKQHQFSEELRYAGKALDGKLNYTVGAYYFQQRIEQYYNVFFFSAPYERSGGILHHHTWSIFAQGDYQFIPHVFLTLGGRYTWEKKSALNAPTPDCTVDLVCTFTFSDSHSWKNFSPKVGLSWKATPHILVYASWTKGFRSGGYNIRNTEANAPAGPYDQEVVKALEGGVKTEFLDGRARVNVAVFHNKFTGLQRTVNQGLVNFIANVASATINGVEFEGTVLPFKNLALTANVGYLDAKYDDYLLPGTTTNLRGKQLVRAPKWTYTLAMTHDLDLGSAGTVTSRLSYTHSGKAPADDPGNYFAPAYDLIDGSIGWSPANNENLRVSLWGKNLTNEKYALTATYVGAFFTNLYQAPPRRYGVELKYKF